MENSSALLMEVTLGIRSECQKVLWWELQMVQYLVQMLGSGWAEWMARKWKLAPKKELLMEKLSGPLKGPWKARKKGKLSRVDWKD